MTKVKATAKPFHRRVSKKWGLDAGALTLSQVQDLVSGRAYLESSAHLLCSLEIVVPVGTVKGKGGRYVLSLGCYSPLTLLFS